MFALPRAAQSRAGFLLEVRAPLANQDGGPEMPSGEDARAHSFHTAGPRLARLRVRSRVLLLIPCAYPEGNPDGGWLSVPLISELPPFRVPGQVGWMVLLGFSNQSSWQTAPS